MGVGLIQIDEIKYTDPSIPELLDSRRYDRHIRFQLERCTPCSLQHAYLANGNTNRDLPEDLFEYAYDGRPLQRMTGEQMWDSIVSLVVKDLDERKGHGSRYVTDEFKQHLEDVYLMPIEKLVTTYTDEFIDKYAKKSEMNNVMPIKCMTDISGNRFKDWKGRPLRETKSYSYFNFNSWTLDHMTDPRWRGIERGLVRASELPSPPPATTLFDNSDNPTAKVLVAEAKSQA